MHFNFVCKRSFIQSIWWFCKIQQFTFSFPVGDELEFWMNSLMDFVIYPHMLLDEMCCLCELERWMNATQWKPLEGMRDANDDEHDDWKSMFALFS